MTTRERRQFGRRRTLKFAIIRAPGCSAIRCAVVDISEGGAKIQLQDAAAVPAQFELSIEADDFAVTCQLVYRQDLHAGVKFVSSPRRLSWAQGERRDSARISVRKAIEPQNA